VALLGELGVIEQLVGRLEISAAVLPVGIEEQPVEAAVQVVMMCNVALGARAGVELL
jgi:hypothetical protein